VLPTSHPNSGMTHVSSPFIVWRTNAMNRRSEAFVMPY
jgi:hypothetical protein